MAIGEFLIALGIPVLRSVGGWLQNSLEDNKISDFEWRQLAVTFFSVGTPAVVLYFGLNAAGFDLSPIAASCGGFLADMILRAVKKRKVA